MLYWAHETLRKNSMAHPSLLKNYQKTLRKTKQIYNTLKESQTPQALKALEFQSKLCTIIEQHREHDFTERLKQLDIQDVPLEALQKWLGQMSAGSVSLN